MKKIFHVGDILTIIYDRLLSPNGMKGVYDLLNFMTQDNLATHQLPRAFAECKPYLIEQFPHLDGPYVRFAVAELLELLKRTPREDEKNLLIGWISKLACGKYGVIVHESYEVEALPPHTHEFIDPESELAEKVHPSRIFKI